jgi:putative hydrolase of the HAD superfamily
MIEKGWELLILFLFLCTMDFDALIFDLGGVIINLDYTKTIHAFEQLGMENFHDVYSQAAQTNLFDDFETGKISAQRFINSLLPYLKPGTTPNMVVHAWNVMILDVPQEKLQLLESLKGKMPVFLLSNTNELHVPVVRREWSKVTSLPMEHYFDRIFFSHEIHLRKPDRSIFEYVCENEGLVPERTLFIDDSIQHIEGASAYGLQTIHLTEPQSLLQFFS